MKTGVYIIRNLLNGRVYVGSAVDIAKRWRGHRNLLSKGQHHARHLQHAWDRYGSWAFEFVFIEPVQSISDLLPREQHWIEYFHAVDSECGYNTALFAGAPMRGRKQTEETKRWCGDRLRGRQFSPEHRAKLSAALKGKNQGKRHAHGAEWRRKIGEASARNWKNPDYRAQMADWNGRQHSAASIDKIRTATQQRWLDPVYRLKHAEGMKRANERKAAEAHDCG